MFNNAPNSSATGPTSQPNTAAPNFPASNFSVPGAPAPSYSMPGSYGLIYVPSQPVALRAAMGCAIAVMVLSTLSSLYVMAWRGVEVAGLSWIGFTAIGGLVIWQLWQGARWAHILVIVDCALYLVLNLLGLLLLPLLRQIGVPVLEVIGLAGAYHYGDPNVFFVLALGRTALDVVLHIAIIILLAQPQVLQYFKAHADLRSISVK
jgi:membrane protein